jgi:hypothetical protein
VTSSDRLAATKRVARCSKLIKQKKTTPALSQVPLRLRNMHLELFKTFGLKDSTGDGIVQLADRSDVLAVRHVSKKLFHQIMKPLDFYAWCLLAQRIYDPITLEKVFLPYFLKNR